MQCDAKIETTSKKAAVWKIGLGCHEFGIPESSGPIQEPTIGRPAIHEVGANSANHLKLQTTGSRRVLKTIGSTNGLIARHGR